MTRWLAPEEVSEITGLSLRSLQEMRTQRRGIPFSKPDSKTVRYSADHVEAFMQSRVVQPLKRPAA